jgi:hypothetical protein
VHDFSQQSGKESKHAALRRLMATINQVEGITLPATSQIVNNK